MPVIVHKTKCPDCGVDPGELHKHMCDIEQCPTCKGQYISCGHSATDNEALPYPGYYPGYLEALALGMYVYAEDPTDLASPLIACDHDNDNARPDLNLIYSVLHRKDVQAVLEQRIPLIDRGSYLEGQAKHPIVDQIRSERYGRYG